MGSFKRSLFGYRRPDVDAAIFTRDGRIKALERRVSALGKEVEAGAELERETASLSGMVIERER